MDSLLQSYHVRRSMQSLPDSVSQSTAIKFADTGITTAKAAEKEPVRSVSKITNVSQQVTKTTEHQIPDGTDRMPGGTGMSVTSKISKVHSVSSKASTTTSQRLREIEFRRIQEEYELEMKLDEDRLALERKALELREKREKKLMDQKYKTMAEIVSVSGASSAGTKSEFSSAKSQTLKQSTHSRLMMQSWIQNQRSQNYNNRPIDPIGDEGEKRTMLDAYGVDLSIPVDDKELQRIYQRQSESRKNETAAEIERSRPTQQEVDSRHSVDNQTYIHQEGPYTSKLAAAYAYSRRHIPMPSEKDRIVRDPDDLYGPQPEVPHVNTSHSGPHVNTSHSKNENNESKFAIPVQHLPNNQSNSWSNSAGAQRSQIELTRNQIASRQSVAKEGLPEFHGRPIEWIQFIQTYEDTTELCGFSKSENLSRLRKCLKGKARELVESQLFMPNCVDQIIDALREKFGKPELIAKEILAKIRAEPVIKPDKLEALADFGYKVRNACNIIEFMGLHFHLYDPDLVRDIVLKLPSQIKIKWAEHAERMQASTAQVNLRTISDWLHKLARTLNLVTTLEGDLMPAAQNCKNKAGYTNYHEKSKPEQSSQSKCPSCSKGCKNVRECSTFKELTVDDRWKLVLEKKLCRNCLNGHRNNCTNTKFRFCGVSGCEQKHNSLLHNVERHSKFTSKRPTSDRSKEEGTENKSINRSESSNGSAIKGKPNNVHQVESEEELFRILPVTLYHNGKSKQTFAFFDEGSSYTLMDKRTANELNATGSKENICLLWTKGIHRQEESLNIDLEISGTNGFDVKHQLKSVNVVEDLGLAIQSIDPQRLTKRFRYLKGLPLPKYSNAVPTILIGLRHIRLTTPLETVEGNENEPIASRSRLGWTVCGPIDGKGSGGIVNHHVVTRCPCGERDEDLHQMVKEHFTIENFGVSINSADVDSKQNQKALEMMKKYTIRKGDRFETRLLWKNESYKLPESYDMARKRLTCVENKGANVVKIIDDIIADYVKKGYATKLSPTQQAEEHPRTFYLPIFTVSNPKKPGKIRPVFDAAATVKGTSLNSALLTGPDLLSPLVNILRRFREHKVATAGDIEEMFHRVLVNERDRCSQRFLWRNGEKSRKPDVYQFNVMTFGSKCSPAAAQFVKNTNAEEYKVQFPVAANSIINNHYVDDMLDGAETIKKAVQLINDVKYVHSKAGFNIRNFKSNSKEVLEAIGETNGAKKVDLADGNIERVLGMFWDTESDCFMFSLKYTKLTPEILEGKILPTKRELLRLTMSLFDPLGLISHYIIHARILMQNVWKTQIGWDERLPEQLAGEWNRWINSLKDVESLKIPRWYSTKLSSKVKMKIELHTFVDAGEDAFAAAAYLRISDDEGTDCSLIGSKARVSPLKYLSTPRKELMAGVLGSRLANSVKDGLSLKIDRRIIWSDSITVLTWLQSEHKKYSQFVAHRVGEILENTDLKEWRWVPSKLNVADEATKWNKTPTFDASSRWFTGPEFLQRPEDEWPQQKHIIPNSTTEEMKVSCSHSKLIVPSFVDATRFSTWSRLQRAVANAKCIANWMVSKQKRLALPNLKIKQEDLLEAERKLIRQAQWEGFTEEMTILTRNQISDPAGQKPIGASSSIKDCTPYLDEFGIMRVKGRIDSATAVTKDAKRPIILPKGNPVTKLIVLSYHTKFKHQNHETVVNELKQKFYIPQIRTVVRSVRWNCRLCALRRCRPRNPQMADLPPIRFEAGIRPFTYTGIDFFGPYKVKVGRQYPKRWGVIYTCLTTRAVWIDVVPNYDTEACILSIRDFINRKGVVQEFYTDNGTNFKGADNELTREISKINFERLSDEFTSCYTKWKFNPPETPHMGGMWERLIGAIKISIQDSMITRTPTDQMLRSWLIEAENIINSRPITFVPIESDEDEALTPNHFMLGSSNGLKPPGDFTSDGPYLRKQWKEVQRCTNIFWKRFIREYCPTLIRRTKWFDSVKPLEVGDLVINFDENAPRNTYKRGRIVETIIGTNRQVRRAKVQFPNGSTLWRPANRLGLLDVKATPTTSKGLDHPTDDINEGENVGAPNSSEPPPIAIDSEVSIY